MKSRLQLLTIGGASKMIKPLYCYSVAVFFICDPSEERDDALAKCLAFHTKNIVPHVNKRE